MGAKTHTWTQGVNICAGKNNNNNNNNENTCSRCGRLSSGKLSCCAKGGSWRGMCGTSKQAKAHTWTQGVNICAADIVREIGWIDHAQGGSNHSQYEQLERFSMEPNEKVVRKVSNAMIEEITYSTWFTYLITSVIMW